MMVLSACPDSSRALRIRPTLRSTSVHVGEILGAELPPSLFRRGVVDVSALHRKGIEAPRKVVFGAEPVHERTPFRVLHERGADRQRRGVVEVI